MDTTHIDFLAAANKVSDTTHRMGNWELWGNYDVRSHKDGGRYVLAVETDESELPLRIDLGKALQKYGGVVSEDNPETLELVSQAAKRDRARKEGWVYYPLVRHPGLFLEFARLADGGGLDNAATVRELDTDKNADVALNWARTYGTLGLTPGDEKIWFRGASTRGGPPDSVAAFALEVWVANGCLRLYEAATSAELDEELIASYIGDNRGSSPYTRTPASTRAWALDTVARETQARVAGNAFPALYGSADNFVSGYSFTNLLGALWLQMFWLLTASEAPRRCGNPDCDQIIAFEQPLKPLEHRKGERKKPNTYRNKGYCSKTCANHHYYLTTTKPNRRAARGL